MPWVQIGGSAASLMTGDSRIYATNSGTGDVWQYDGTPMRWTEIGGPDAQFVVCWDLLYGLTPDRRRIWEYKGIPWHWRQISRDRPIGRLIGSHDFEREPGTGAVRPVLYATDQATDNLWRYSGTHLDGTAGTWVEIGGPGSMFVEVFDRRRSRYVLYGLTPDRSAIWEYTGTPWQWQQVGGPATTIVGGWETLMATGPDGPGWRVYRGTPMQWLPLAVPLADPIEASVQSLSGGTLILAGRLANEYQYYLTPDGEHVWAKRTRALSPPGMVHATRWIEIGGAARTIAPLGDCLVALHPAEGNVMLFTWPHDVEIADSVLPQARVGSDYSFGFRATGGRPPYLWWARSNLPNGMGLLNGRVIGRPSTAGTTSFEVAVSDEIGTTATKQLSITVEPAPTEAPPPIYPPPPVYPPRVRFRFLLSGDWSTYIVPIEDQIYVRVAAPGVLLERGADYPMARVLDHWEVDVPASAGSAGCWTFSCHVRGLFPNGQDTGDLWSPPDSRDWLVGDWLASIFLDSSNIDPDRRGNLTWSVFYIGG